MESIWNSVDIRLCSKEKKVEKLIAQTNFEIRTIFAENLVAVHMKKTKIIFNKPIYVGMSTLDISKIYMYDFYYNVMKKQYHDKVSLLYTVTDFLIMEIKTKDFHNDVKNNMINEFDTSDYPIGNVYNIPLVNKKAWENLKTNLRVK